jgi:hypothetical protein
MVQFFKIWPQPAILRYLLLLSNPTLSPHLLLVPSAPAIKPLLSGQQRLGKGKSQRGCNGQSWSTWLDWKILRRLVMDTSGSVRCFQRWLDQEGSDLISGWIHWWKQNLGRLLGGGGLWKVGPSWRKCVAEGMPLKGLSWPSPLLWLSLSLCFLAIMRCTMHHDVIPHSKPRNTGANQSWTETSKTMSQDTASLPWVVLVRYSFTAIKNLTWWDGEKKAVVTGAQLDRKKTF